MEWCRGVTDWHTRLLSGLRPCFYWSDSLGSDASVQDEPLKCVIRGYYLSQYNYRPWFRSLLVDVLLLLQVSKWMHLHEPLWITLWL